MKNIWTLLVVLLSCIQFTQAQFNFKQHKVEKGEDVYSIAKLYGTTPDAIYNLNPMAKEGIQPDTFIVLPNVVAPPEKFVEGIVFKKHKTKKKETLYSISRKYTVSVDDIKEYNTFLESDPLRKGDILKIPLPAPKMNKVVRKLGGKKKSDTDGLVSKNSAKATKIYTVQPKETRYGIARKFGITIPELENMNPNLGEDFPIGIQILVPAEVSDDSTNTDQKFKLYQVMPKETVYSLTRRFEISSDSLAVLNPAVKDGLKAGMILRLPNLDDLNLTSSGVLMNLENRISYPNTKNIAVMLPFGMNKVDFDEEDEVKEHIKKSKVVRLTVDFYSGILLAVEAAKQKGISVNLDVYDTQKSDAVVSKLIKSKNLELSDAIIGPLYKKNVEKAASLLTATNTPVLSPISNKVDAKLKNLFQTVPTAAVLEDKIIAFVKNYTSEKSIIIIADKKNAAIKEKLQTAFPNAKVLDPEEENFITETKLTEALGKPDDKKKTLVFLESANMQLISNVVPFLNAKAKSHKITLFTTNKSNAYDNESILNTHLSNLKFHYPSMQKEVDTTKLSEFYKNYKSKYGVMPNHYAVRGYDLAYDLLLRLGSSFDIYEQASQNFTTEYNEYKFGYVMSPEGGYTNAACYIMRYAEGLQFKVVE
ncbi:LysM peptidoglycan-binding domain-containing protein [Aquimarina agarivorans]|uniref:LysM peptidoglycan-binding domain-containing protein n=1 Tax=Aquimarina agarivorans TaxID=980584 RepID=UPI000248EAB8|nr:LysM peptidoglycan-binding domain-containing protein [Aquimarina agarivorans]